MLKNTSDTSGNIVQTCKHMTTVCTEDTFKHMHAKQPPPHHPSMPSCPQICPSPWVSVCMFVTISIHSVYACVCVCALLSTFNLHNLCSPPLLIPLSISCFPVSAWNLKIQTRYFRFQVNENICNGKQVSPFFFFFFQVASPFPLPPTPSFPCLLFHYETNTSLACEVRSRAGVAKCFVFRLIFRGSAAS